MRRLRVLLLTSSPRPYKSRVRAPAHSPLGLGHGPRSPTDAPGHALRSARPPAPLYAPPTRPSLPSLCTRAGALLIIAPQTQDTPSSLRLDLRRTKDANTEPKEGRTRDAGTGLAR